ncbi:MAG: flagellar motor switch protein FliG [Burkholderiaceae bacterium]
MTEERDGLADAAILLMSLGEEAAAEVIRRLTPKEAEALGRAMADIQVASQDQINGVLELLADEMGKTSLLIEDSGAYVRSVMTRALGENKASILVNRIIEEPDTPGIENLRWMTAPAIADLLRSEHPQIVASVLVHLEPLQASAVVGLLPEELRGEIMMRISTLSDIQPAAMNELNAVLADLLSGPRSNAGTSLGGTKIAAEILNFMGSAAEQTVIAWIQEKDDALAEKISDQMFVFSDLMSLDDKAIQMVLREAQTDSLIIALKGADPDLREKIFKNMSQRAAESLREDLDSRGPVKVSEVESEQKEILKSVKRLADEGQIVLGSGGDDGYV